jgi:polyisoprenoid-binding protein YceI
LLLIGATPNMQRIFLILTIVGGAGSAAFLAAATTYRVNPAKSHLTIHVGKAGAFSFIAGHKHDVGGPIQSGSVDVDLDTPSQSRVRLTIAAADLKVSPAGEPEGDAPKVQEAMDSEKVLDLARHPTITYESTGVTIKSRRGDSLDLMMTGQVTIRDVAQPVTAPVHVEIQDNMLTATGRFSVTQSAFGIKPISVGGVVAVKDALDIEFSIAADR